MHGVSKTVTFDVEGLSEPAKDPWGNTRIGLSATTKINRKDFGLSYNAALKTGGVLVGEEVTITLDVQFIKTVNSGQRTVNRKSAGCADCSCSLSAFAELPVAANIVLAHRMDAGPRRSQYVASCSETDS